MQPVGRLLASSSAQPSSAQPAAALRDLRSVNSLDLVRGLGATNALHLTAFLGYLRLALASIWNIQKMSPFGTDFRT